MGGWINRNLFSIISLLLSIIAMYMSFRNSPFFIDINAAILVSVATILSVPTAVLVGWQIYNAIQLNKIKRDTLQAKDRILKESNHNLLMSFHGLADYFTSQFLYSNNENEEVRRGLYYGALLYRSMEIDLCAKQGQLEMFNLSIKTMTAVINDCHLITNQESLQIQNILSSVPESWQTEEFLELNSILRFSNNN